MTNSISTFHKAQHFFPLQTLAFDWCRSQCLALLLSLRLYSTGVCFSFVTQLSHIALFFFLGCWNHLSHRRTEQITTHWHTYAPSPEPAMLVSLLRSSGGAHFAQIVNWPVHAIPCNKSHWDLCCFADVGNPYPTQSEKISAYLRHPLDCANDDDQNHPKVSSQRSKQREHGWDEQPSAKDLLCSQYPREVSTWN